MIIAINVNTKPDINIQVWDMLPIWGVYCVYTLTIAQFCVNYSVHHVSFVQTIIVRDRSL